MDLGGGGDGDFLSRSRAEMPTSSKPKDYWREIIYHRSTIRFLPIKRFVQLGSLVAFCVVALVILMVSLCEHRRGKCPGIRIRRRLDNDRRRAERR